MKRRDFLSGLVASAALTGPALAQDYVDSVIAQLSGMGFRSIRQERTLLGRVRILATRNDGRREIIINPNNGEILRDLWIPLDEGSRSLAIINDKPDRGGGGSGSDDDDDESDDEDNSGSGGGGGSGGGDGGDGDDDDDDSDDDDDG